MSGCRLATPALFISTSRCPNLSCMLVAAALIDVSSVTSSCTADTFPVIPSCFSSPRACVPFSRDRQARITWNSWEACASTLAVARPMPELAPFFYHVNSIV